jgi:hypothetical protein
VGGSRTWLAAAGRISFAAGLGALLGWGMSADADWSATASLHECATNDGLCFGVAPVIGLVSGVLVAVAACWAGMAVARVRPLMLSVPAGIIALPVTADIYLRIRHGGGLHPGWLFALATGLAFALLAACLAGLPDDPRRARRTRAT